MRASFARIGMRHNGTERNEQKENAKFQSTTHSADYPYPLFTEFNHHHHDIRLACKSSSHFHMIAPFFFYRILHYFIFYCCSLAVFKWKYTRIVEHIGCKQCSSFLPSSNLDNNKKKPRANTHIRVSFSVLFASAHELYENWIWNAHLLCKCS